MNPLILPLEAADKQLCGNKAAALATLLQSGLKVPRGFCVTTEAYRCFIEANNLHGLIAMELGRKRLEDMRWEEMWDTSLRIRSGFLRASISEEIRDAIKTAARRLLGEKAVVVRSSSHLEDTAGGSYAGLHESFVNVLGAAAILHHIKLVWASLWSDAVLAYARELEIEKEDSAMAIIVQELVAGERSGVAFGINPSNERESVIEAVFGLNKGLVDGDVEPDRYLLDRETGEIRSTFRADHGRYVMPSRRGTVFTTADPGTGTDRPLDGQGVRRVFSALKRVEEIFGSPQDMEWTMAGRMLYVLQSRPITTGRVDTNERRAFDLSLKKSFDTLKNMSARITNEFIPAMINESDRLRSTDVAGLADEALTDEINRRTAAHRKWQAIYWNEFIPFAHGVRLFGQVYNDRVKPDDPFEFVDLLSSTDTLGMKRNRALQELAASVRLLPDFETASLDELDPVLAKRIDRFIEESTSLTCGTSKCEDEKEAVLTLLKEMAKGTKRRTKRRRRENLLDRYLSRFDRGEQEYARELYEIAQTSYRLRDDDNIYLGRFESALEEVMEESRRRLGERCTDNRACTNPEEVIRALRFPQYRPHGSIESNGGTGQEAIRARQLRGQPAGPGVARGPAHVVETTDDLLSVKHGEILVCDAIDPNMTFVIPLVSGIVERRGGMLVHGAIIAREYGLPCVTGVPDATQVIRSGDALTVDGYFGLVIIHQDGGDA
jgi:pyruvate,water dikinase